MRLSSFYCWSLLRKCLSLPYPVVVLIRRDLDQASMEAVVSLLAGLPLQPEEGDGVELMEAKSQLFLK